MLLSAPARSSEDWVGCDLGVLDVLDVQVVLNFAGGTLKQWDFVGAL